MCFSVAVNVLFLGVASCSHRVCPPQSTSSLELEGRGSFIATFKTTLLVLTEILDDFEVLDVLKRDFDELAIVALCKLGPYPQLKIDLLN